MKQTIFFPFFLFAAWSLHAQSTALFDDSRVSKIFVELPADSLHEMIGELVNDYYYHARFVFDDGIGRDTVENAGIRLRGNTSLGAKKKSFKISFNEYQPGREYQGVRKLNLLGSHNDPTMIRQKLFYEVWEKAGMPARRGSFAQLYINGEYRGLYLNMEEIDKQWLTRAFGDNDGNLYKCTYPADLAYLGNYSTIYKNILNNPETRAYDLVTNEAADDYARFVELLRRLYQPVDANFAANIDSMLNVQSVLKSFAIDVATGNWDDYFYNKNNFYLYDNPATGRFEFVTFDTDNTFGVDWLGKDWARRNCLQWLPSAPQKRPLATQLLQVPVYYDQFVQYLDSVTRFVTRPDSIFPRINFLHQLIIPAAAADVYRSLDYGYSMADFHNGFTQTVDSHTPYGIKPFLAMRYDSTMRQLANLLGSVKSAARAPLGINVFPNPATDWLMLAPSPSLPGETIFGTLQDMTGRSWRHWQWPAADNYRLDLSGIPAGVYQVRLRSGGQHGQWLVLKGAD